ncbi:hypothetical protein EW026_g5795 [Hermanssonia centrifuga]|uniref:Uncharacterized protein n=1 Tax=Hermanssonia centrifuga TaxID=98765 RepID=A0A4S4KHE0_9APHY|nr:hypothetical protein EW026_g5795 [Hermanssonia centrifuga]
MEDSMPLYRRALQGAQESGLSESEIVREDPFYVDTLNSLAVRMALRYADFQDLDDLNESIGLSKRVRSLCPPDHPYRHGFIASLAHALTQRGTRLHSIDDLDEAERLYQEALTQASEANRPIYLASIAHFLRIRYENFPTESHYLDKAIAAAEEVIALSEHLELQQKTDVLYNLACSHSTRFGALKRAADAEAALEYMEQAVHISEAGHVHARKALYYSSLAQLYLDQDPSYFDVRIGLEYLTSALDDTHTSARIRLTYMRTTLDSVRWVLSTGKEYNISGLHYLGPSPDPRADARLTLAFIRYSLGLVNSIDWKDQKSFKALVEVHMKAVRLLPEIAYFGLDVQSRLVALREFGELTSIATLLACFERRGCEAVEIMEEGRALFWSQALKLRTQFDELPADIRTPLSTLSRDLESESYRSTELGILPPPRAM